MTNRAGSLSKKEKKRHTHTVKTEHRAKKKEKVANLFYERG
jgi:hypothetical protein